MRTLERTTDGVIIEVTSSEILEKGFDLVWDEIREVFPENSFVIKKAEEKIDKKIILIYLKKIKKLNQSSDSKK